MVLRLSVFPSGDVTVGYVPDIKKKLSPEASLPAENLPLTKIDVSLIEARLNELGTTLKNKFIDPIRYVDHAGVIREIYSVGKNWSCVCTHLPCGTVKIKRYPEPYGLILYHDASSILFESTKPFIFQKTPVSAASRRKKGTSGISGAARRRVSSACSLLELDAHRDSLSFLTLTVPPLDEGDYASLRDQWGGICKGLLAWLKYHLEKVAGYGKFEYVYCTEVQTKRLEDTGGSYLHLHILFKGRLHPGSAWILRPAQIREFWNDLLGKRFSSVEYSSSCENIQRVKGDAGRYIGKYMSKGGSGLADNAADAQLSEIAGLHWISVSPSLSLRVRNSTIVSSVRRYDSFSGVLYRYLLSRSLSGDAGFYREFRRDVSSNRDSLRISLVCGYGRIRVPCSVVIGGFKGIVQYLELI